MVAARNALLVLLFLPLLSFAQSTNTPQVEDENGLLAEMMAVKSSEESITLLRLHRQHITGKLCDKLIEEADKLYYSNDYPKSLLIYGIAKQGAEELNDNLRLVKTLNSMGFAYMKVGDYKKAREYSEQSLATAEAAKNKNWIASALLTIGTVNLWEGNHKEALYHLQSCLTLYKELNEPVFTADALITIGQVYSVTGHYAQSFNYYNQAMGILKTLNDKPRLEDLFTSMGTLYAEQGDYEKMVDYLNQALEIAKEINDQMAIATILVNEGIAYREQGDYEKALKPLQESLKIAEEINSPGFTIYPQAALGAVYRLQGKYDLALDYLKRSLALAEQVGDKAETATILFHLGELHNSKRDYVKAIEYSDRAASLSKQINLPQTCYLALTEKGKALRALEQPDLAQKNILEAVATIEQLRSQVSGGEHDYQRFFQNRVSPYHEMIDLFFDRNDPAQALVYAERAKARVLLDVLRNGRVNINKLMSRDEQLEEQRLYVDLISLNAQVNAGKMRQPPDDMYAKGLETQLQKARNAYEEFQVNLYAAHPEMKVKQGLLPQFTMQDASTLIPDDRTALLEYAVKDDRTFLFVLTRDSKRQSKIEIRAYSIKAGRDELSKLVGNFRKLLAVNHPGFRKPAEQLYELLVKPVERQLGGKTTVCIVPDGPLWELPFQALQASADKFLQELYAIYYAPSLQVLREMKKKAPDLKISSIGKNRRNEAALKSELYAIGNPAIGGEALARAQGIRNTPFVPLPETEIEVQTIGAEVYGQKACNIHIGSSAQEEAVKAEMGKYRVVHFATHGVLNDHNPLYSYLVLATGNRSNEDGLLEAWELMEMNLKAEMVVLSACDTARGHIGDGEGMIGMTWALFVAGVPTTVASQWKIPSETTTKLMVAFHKNAKKMSKAEAWREAALEMIKDPRYRMKPFYWAGFVVVGNGGM